MHLTGLESLSYFFRISIYLIHLLLLLPLGVQYRIPDAYDDQEGGVDQEKRFAVAVQRYK